MIVRTFGRRLAWSMTPITSRVRPVVARARRSAAPFAIVVGLGAAGYLWIQPTLPRIDHTAGEPQLLAQAAPAAFDPAIVEAASTVPIGSYSSAVPVLMYHDVSYHPGPYTVTPEQFADHMEALDRAGFTSVTLGQVMAFFRGTASLPDKPILITFDDGVQTNWTQADPILAQHGFHAVAFLITGSIAATTHTYYLTWREVRAMESTGRWEIQAHTHDAHRQIPVAGGGTGPALLNRALRPDGTEETLDEWRARVVADLRQNIADTEEHLGETMTAFAYPFSAYESHNNDPRIPAELQKIVNETFPVNFTGYVTGRTAVRRDASTLIPRIPITNDMTAYDLLLQIHEALPNPLPTKMDDLRWTVEGEGTCGAQGTTVTLTASQFMTCFPAENSSEWTDYTLETIVAGQSRNATAIVAVRASNEGRAEVVIGESTVKLRQDIRGTWTTFGESALAPAGPDGTRHVSITLHETSIDVTIDGAVHLAGVMDPGIRGGHIQFALAPQLKERTVTFTATVIPPGGASATIPSAP